MTCRNSELALQSPPYYSKKHTFFLFHNVHTLFAQKSVKTSVHTRAEKRGESLCSRSVGSRFLSAGHMDTVYRRREAFGRKVRDGRTDRRGRECLFVRHAHELCDDDETVKRGQTNERKGAKNRGSRDFLVDSESFWDQKNHPKCFHNFQKLQSL